MITSDEELASAVREALGDLARFREVKMFGGIGFLINGNMLAATSKRGLLVRVGKEKYAESLKKQGASAMIMRGRAMDGYVFVDPQALDSRRLKTWLQSGLTFVQTLPKKQASNKTRGTKEKTK